MTDGIDPRNGVFWPIEYKSHKDALPSDELELAFYWVTGWTSPRRKAQPRPGRPHRGAPGPCRHVYAAGQSAM